MTKCVTTKLQGNICYSLYSISTVATSNKSSTKFDKATTKKKCFQHSDLFVKKLIRLHKTPVFPTLESVNFPHLLLFTPLFRKPNPFCIYRNAISTHLSVPTNTATVRWSRPPDLLTHRHSEYKPADIEFKQPKLSTGNISAVPQMLVPLQLNMYHNNTEKKIF